MTWFRNYQRLLALFCAALLLVSQTATAAYSLGEISLKQLQAYRKHPGHFTQAPTRVNLGKNPKREPLTRGIWTQRQLQNAEFDAQTLFATLFAATPPPGHTTAVNSGSGGSYNWEGSKPSLGGGSVNTGNGNKLSTVPLTGWDVRGGMAVNFTLFHNSQTDYNDELGHGWTWTYDIYINDDDINNPVVHWGDGLSVPFSYTGTVPTGVDYNYTSPTGVFDKLTKKADGTWTITKKSQIKYQFNAAGFCNKIQDRNGNQITLTLNSANYVTKITDPTGRELNITLDGSNNFTSITDPLGRVWEFTRDGNDDLTEVEFPPVNSVVYTENFTYNTTHDILTRTDKRGKVWTTTYNPGGVVATEKNPLNQTTTYTYTSSATTITDPSAKPSLTTTVAASLRVKWMNPGSASLGPTTAATCQR